MPIGLSKSDPRYRDYEYLVSVFGKFGHVSEPEKLAKFILSNMIQDQFMPFETLSERLESDTRLIRVMKKVLKDV